MIEKDPFTPFKNRESHWGKTTFRPMIPGVATVLPSDLPEPFLHALMLRMQFEEAQYKYNHLEEEAEYAVWRENSLDLTTWSGRIADAMKSRAKENLAEEMKQVVLEMDSSFPLILPPPPKRFDEQT